VATVDTHKLVTTVDTHKLSAVDTHKSDSSAGFIGGTVDTHKSGHVGTATVDSHETTSSTALGEIMDSHQSDLKVLP
jgi:hypothetical protein